MSWGREGDSRPLPEWSMLLAAGIAEGSLQRAATGWAGWADSTVGQLQDKQSLQEKADTCTDCQAWCEYSSSSGGPRRKRISEGFRVTSVIKQATVTCSQLSLEGALTRILDLLVKLLRLQSTWFSGK